MAQSRSLPLWALASALLCSTALMAQTTAPTVRITGPIDENQLVTLKGNISPFANAQNDRGPVSASLPMADLVLVLSRSPEQQAAFDAFVASQYDSGSPNYHQWLLPAEIGARFGPAEADIATIENWLTGNGFAINQVAKDGMTIEFSGTAGQVESAFRTQIHNLLVNGFAHLGNMTDPEIPAALAPVVVGVKSLNNFFPRPLHKLGSKVEFNSQLGHWQRIVSAAPATSMAAGSKLPIAAPAAALNVSGPRPEFGINGCETSDTPCPTGDQYLEEDVTPYDFATIYNVLPLWNANINGTGQTIAIAGTSDIDLSDVSTFRSAFGLPAGLTPIVVKGANGIDPGVCAGSTNVCSQGDLIENSLDVEWSGAVAPGAQIVLVTSGYNSQTAPTNDAVYQSAQYVVNNHGNSSYPTVANANILSVSYGECEQGNGTASNVAYYDLWQSAATEGISVFVATGDSGSPSCDQGGDASGTPYLAQYGLSVSGLASTPYNTAVGGTDFSWCKPTIIQSGSNAGDIQGCPATSTSQGSPAYWNTSNNTTTGASAAGYVPEIPWNNTCTNPILAVYLESIATFTGTAGVSNAEAACNFVENNWPSIYTNYQVNLSSYVDTVGGGGGASNCVVNSSNPNSTTFPSGSCTTGSTSTGAANGSIPLVNDGWVVPSPNWQTEYDIPGTSGLTNRAIPDVSFFAANGELGSATLICVSALGSCVTSSEVGTNPVTSEPLAQEVGGTSVSTPEMAGVMALIDQKAGSAQGLANPGLYALAGRQTYSGCSTESVKAGSASCFFNDIDQGTISMACSLGTANCTKLNSGDTIGTLVSSGITPAYNGATGYDMATGLGSLNVANVVNATGVWMTVGPAVATLTAHASPTTITINQALSISVTVTGASGTPTGNVTVSGGGFNGTQALSGGAATINIPANSLTAGSDTLTVTYSGDPTYASTSQPVTVTVNVMTPTVTVNAPSNANGANALSVTVTVTGPTGATSTPSGSVSLAGGGYSSGGVTLVGGSATFNIPANTLTAGSDTLTVTYSGDSYYAGNTGTAAVTVATTPTVQPEITVAPASGSADSGQSLGVTIKVAGTSGTPTGTVTLEGGSYTSAAVTLVGGSASFTIPSNSLTAGTVTLTASYSGDVTYKSYNNTGSVTVTQSTFALAATTPASVAPGAITTSTVTVTSSTHYTGGVTLTCTVTAGPADANISPSCSAAAGSPVAMTNGTAGGTATLSIGTTPNSTALLRRSKAGGKGWMGAGGGAMLAFLVFLGIPSRRRWRSMLGLVVLMAALGSLSACGGGGSANGSGNGSTGTTYSGTAPGSYTITITGQGNDPASTTATTTFTLTVS